MSNKKITPSSSSTIPSSLKSHVRRKRPRPTSSLLFTTLLLNNTNFLIQAAAPKSSPSTYTVTWNHGPEDHFFCGQSWDDYNCPTRQNCRSGKSEECAGFFRGETCFKDTPCDSAKGGGREFSYDLYDTDIPTFSPTIYVGVPTLEPMTRGPTEMPTDYPIGSPPDLVWPSENPSDHWFCGVGIDDANERCGLHCPSASECPVGQICYFGTKCDARTHAPTPPPTNRPTKKPTPGPSASPTITVSPTVGPTSSLVPSAAPTMPQPTKSPTPAPTQSPTHGPLTAIQSGFFCATDWNDAITNCKMRCPSGEDPECPVGEFCFAYTGCTEERGYPDGRPPMRHEASPESEQDESESTTTIPEECFDFKVVITADDWPAETSWDVTLNGEIVVEGTNDPLVPGEAVEYLECLPKECYEFTIHDTGGDGLCCEHGEGGYEVYYDGKMVKEGGVFYDSDVWVFGRCGETPAPVAMSDAPSPAPSPAPVKSKGSTASSDGGGSNNAVTSGSEGGSKYRCVQQSLLDRGYVIDADLCPRFTDCYNKFIEMGDDWFCKDGEMCTETANCGEGVTGSAEIESEQDEQQAVESEAEEVGQEAEEAEEEIEFEETSDEPHATTPVGRPPTASNPGKPAPVGRPVRPNPSLSTLTVPDPTPAPVASTPSPVASTPEPTITATSLEPSLTPTTSKPTQGACDGLPCNRDKFCRSEHGFCGPGDGYCNEKSIWTKDCKKQSTPPPSAASTPNPTEEPATQSPVLAEIFGDKGKPSFTKPSGGGKPSGGKGPAKKTPKPTPTPTSEAPTDQVSESPTEIGDSNATPPPTATFLMFSSEEETDFPTPSPEAEKESQGLSLGTVNFVSLPSDLDVPIQIITDAPTPSPAVSKDIQENSAVLETSADETDVESTSTEYVNEFECTGEPCDQDTWCRSIFGSCGPGFIYCNAKAIWTSSCRITHPQSSGTVSKEVPSAGAESVQVTGANDSDAQPNVATVPVSSPILGLPALPKPTLPTISDATVFTDHQSFAAHFATTDSSRGDDDHEDDDDYTSAVSEPKENKPKATESYTYPTMYDSPEYAQQWSEWAKQVQSSALKSSPKTISFALLSLSAILLYA